MAVDHPLKDPLISRLREREHEAIGTLIDRHYAAVHRYLARLLGDGEVAAELTQDTFLRAYQALPRLAADSHLEGWLFRIATNLARQHRRRQRVVCWTRLEAAGPLSAGGAGGGSLEDAVVQQDLVRRALARLPLDHRACLLLYAWTGYTCGEIGAIVGKTPEAVRMTLSRARRRFRVAYGAAAGPPARPGAVPGLAPLLAPARVERAPGAGSGRSPTGACTGRGGDQRATRGGVPNRERPGEGCIEEA